MLSTGICADVVHSIASTTDLFARVLPEAIGQHAHTTLIADSVNASASHAGIDMNVRISNAHASDSNVIVVDANDNAVYAGVDSSEAQAQPKVQPQTAQANGSQHVMDTTPPPLPRHSNFDSVHT